MDDETKRKIQERYAKLPAEFQQALAGSKFQQQVLAIGQKYSLHIDQIGKLENEVLMAMLGLTDLSDFPAQLQRELATTEEQANAVATDLAEEIFIPLRKALEDARAPTQPAPPTPPTTPIAAVAPAAVPIVSVKAAVIIGPSTQLAASAPKLPTVAESILLAPSTAPAQKITIQNTASKPVASVTPAATTLSPIKKSIDPYREPTN
jgi:hypothetical protein